MDFLINGLVRHSLDTGLDDWATKLVAVCTDGAAVNIGMYLLRQETLLCTTRTLYYTKSVDCSVPYCDTFNRPVVRLLQFYFQSGGAKSPEKGVQ